jgi:hypothetical protein
MSFWVWVAVTVVVVLVVASRDREDDRRDECESACHVTRKPQA